MSQITLKRTHGLWLIVILLIAAVTVGVVHTVFAAEGISLSCSPSSIPANIPTTITCVGAPVQIDGSTYCGWSESWIFSADVDIQGGWLTSDGIIIFYYLDVSQETYNDHGNFQLLGCASSEEPDFFAPGVWAMDLCEPNDGFSGDGWMSLDSNVIPPDTKLYVGPSADGPWYETEFLQPPYIMSQANVDALTGWMGLIDYHELWFRPGDIGIAANLGSMIADREANMDALCGN